MTVLPGAKVRLPDWLLTVVNWPPGIFACRLTVNVSNTLQVLLLFRTVAVQWTVPLGLQEIVTCSTSSVHMLQPSGVAVLVGVFVGVLVAVLAGVLVGVLVGVSLGELVGVLVGV